MNDIKIMLLKGESGNSIEEMEKTETVGLVDTYTVTLTDGTTFEFEVTNGKGITSITKTETVGLVDTYTILYDDASTQTFQVTNGAKGDKGDTGNGISSITKTGTSGVVDTYTITYTNGTTSTFTVTNGLKEGTCSGAVIANSTAVQALSTAQMRNIAISDTDLTAGTSQLATGEVYIYYT